MMMLSVTVILVLLRVVFVADGRNDDYYEHCDDSHDDGDSSDVGADDDLKKQDDADGRCDPARLLQ